MNDIKQNQREHKPKYTTKLKYTTSAELVMKKHNFCNT